LQKHGIEVHVASLLPGEPPVASKAIASFRFLPTDHIAFAARLTDLTKSLGIELIYPCGDEALELLVAADDLLHGKVKVATPPAFVLQKVLNKGITLETAQDLGIPIPLEHRINDISDLRRRVSSIRFPVIAKARRKDEHTANRINYYNSAEELEAEFQRDPDFGDHVLIQEYLPGGGVGIEVLMSGGKPLTLFQHRRLSELPISGGVSVRARAEPVDSQLAEYAIALLRALQWQGVAMVEFRHDAKTGRLALMEVNGRYWGSLPLSAIAGLEFPWYEWQLAHGETPLPPTSYPLVTMRWLAGEIERTTQFAGEIVYRRMGLIAGLKEMLALPLGFFQPIKDAVWKFDDQSPAWSEIRLVWRRIFRPWRDKILMMALPGYRQRLEDQRMFGSSRAARLFQGFTVKGYSNNGHQPNLHHSKVLVLCHGNIIRSPFVERVLQSHLPSAEVTSAGLGCIPGRPADPRAISAARRYGLDLSDHAARPASQELISAAEAILVMDYRNLAILLAQWPDVARKTYLLAGCGRKKLESTDEISDPYAGEYSAVQDCYDQLYRLCQDIAGDQKVAL
jgi:protein-tyrosine-phosphatase